MNWIDLFNFSCIPFFILFTLSHIFLLWLRFTARTNCVNAGWPLIVTEGSNIYVLTSLGSCKNNLSWLECNHHVHPSRTLLQWATTLPQIDEKAKLLVQASWWNSCADIASCTIVFSVFWKSRVWNYIY